MKLDLLCPPFWRDNQSLIFVFFSEGLCSVVPSQKPFMLPWCLAPSCYLSAVSPDWSLKMEQSPLPCLLLAQADPGLLQLLLVTAPFVGTCHRLQVTARESAPHIAVYQQMWKCFRQGLSPQCRAAAQAHPGAALISDSPLHFALPSVLLPTTQFQ